MQIFVIFNTLVNILIVILCINGKMTYGYGLGDLFVLILNILVIITNIITMFKIQKLTSCSKNIFMLINIIILIAIILKLTIYRGSEYLWNGSIFGHTKQRIS